jgi:hypothetical protein
MLSDGQLHSHRQIRVDQVYIHQCEQQTRHELEHSVPKRHVDIPYSKYMWKSEELGGESSSGGQGVQLGFVDAAEGHARPRALRDFASRVAPT